MSLVVLCCSTTKKNTYFFVSSPSKKGQCRFFWNPPILAELVWRTWRRWRLPTKTSPSRPSTASPPASPPPPIDTAWRPVRYFYPLYIVCSSDWNWRKKQLSLALRTLKNQKIIDTRLLKLMVFGKLCNFRTERTRSIYHLDLQPQTSAQI